MQVTATILHQSLPPLCSPYTVVPPEIEAQPSDVLNAITGGTASFTVVVCVGREVREGGVGERGRAESSSSSGGIEDLNISWEVLRTGSFGGDGMTVTSGTG